MKKLNSLFATFFLLIAFTGLNDCLFGTVTDLNGQGSATWGMTKVQVEKRFVKRANARQVNITRGGDSIIINYRTGQVLKKEYKFRNNSLYQITLTYSHRGQRIINTYNGKYKAFTKIENDTYLWIFPSTIITYKMGTNYTVFTDRRFVAAVKPRQMNIDQITLGMTTTEVRRLMGTPISTATSSGNITIYRYNTGVITFTNLKVTKIRKGTVTGTVTTGFTVGPHNIDMIKPDMTSDEVRRIMGMPVKSVTKLGITIFEYPTGSITFKHMKVVAVAKTEK